MTINQALLALLAAPRDLDGSGLAASVILAEWAILIGPAILVLLWLFGERHDRQAAVTAALTSLVAIAVANVVSTAVFVPRPFMDAGTTNFLEHAPESGFPSDHCTVLFALSFSLLLRRPAGVPRLWMSLLGLSLAVGWARIFLGAHYPLDIAGAALVAAASAALVCTPWGHAVTRAAMLCGEWIFCVLTRRRSA